MTAGVTGVKKLTRLPSGSRTLMVEMAVVLVSHGSGHPTAHNMLRPGLLSDGYVSGSALTLSVHVVCAAPTGSSSNAAAQAQVARILKKVLTRPPETAKS